MTSKSALLLCCVHSGGATWVRSALNFIGRFLDFIRRCHAGAGLGLLDRLLHLVKQECNADCFFAASVR